MSRQCRLWARVFKQAWAVFEHAQLSKRVRLSFRRATVVEKGVVGFSNGLGCQNGHSWVFEQVWLSKRAGWVFKWARLSRLGVERELVVKIGASGF